MIKVEMRKRMTATVYREFFTGTAIAWFTSGVIVPLFTNTYGIREVLTSGISLIATGVFLRLAIYFGKRRRL